MYKLGQPVLSMKDYPSLNDNRVGCPFYLGGIMKKLPELSLLNKLFVYNPKDGTFTRRIDMKGYTIGSLAGSKTHKGYISIMINKSNYFAHRIAWKMFTGKDPGKAQIDHINNVKDDNRIINLRLSNNSLNHANAKIRKDNTTGYKGVYLVDGYDDFWQARIGNKHLGCFRNIKEAALAYNKAAIVKYGKHALVNEMARLLDGRRE